MSNSKEADGSTIHSGGGYTVTVAQDGAIRVALGDSCCTRLFAKQTPAMSTNLTTQSDR